MIYPFSSSTLTVDHLQFAQNGLWEKVRTVYPNNFGDLYELSDWLDKAARDVAVEALFIDSESELSGFFGIRTRDLPSANRTLMWMRLATLVATKESQSFSNLIRLCLTALHLSPELPDVEPTFELGVFNAWNTATPVLLGSSPLEKLTELLETQTGPSWLDKGHRAPICLEYVWFVPTHLWIAKNISTKLNNLYFVDMEKVRHVLSNENP